MNGMFNWDASEGQAIASPYLYVFFVVTIPLTLLVYAGWVFWFRRLEKKYRVNAADVDFAAVESDLMRRMRTATNSWGLEKIEKQATLGAAEKQQ